MNLDEMSAESIRLWIATQLLAAHKIANPNDPVTNSTVLTALDNAQYLINANEFYHQ